MRIFLFIVLAAAAFAADDPYAPLRLYQGKWKSKSKDSVKTDELIDDCGQIGRFFACQQTVDGTPGALLVFLPLRGPGHYLTNSIDPDGRAGGRSQLQIDGSRWVYSSFSEQEGKKTWHRVVNEFTGRDRIHYEISESADGEHWTITRTGDETRVR